MARTQPYRRKPGRPMGPALAAMKRGRTGTGHNPQDLPRTLAKRTRRRRLRKRRVRYRS